MWKGAKRKKALSDRSTENSVALGSDKLKAHLKNKFFFKSIFPTKLLRAREILELYVTKGRKF